jgi:hypothetical protein
LDGFKFDFHQMRLILTDGFLGLNATGVTLDGFKSDFGWTTVLLLWELLNYYAA